MMQTNGRAQVALGNKIEWTNRMKKSSYLEDVNCQSEYSRNFFGGGYNSGLYNGTSMNHQIKDTSSSQGFLREAEAEQTFHPTGLHPVIKPTVTNNWTSKGVDGRMQNHSFAKATDYKLKKNTIV